MNAERSFTAWTWTGREALGGAAAILSGVNKAKTTVRPANRRPFIDVPSLASALVFLLARSFEYASRYVYQQYSLGYPGQVNCDRPPELTEAELNITLRI